MTFLKKEKNKNLLIRILLLIGSILIFVPYIYSVFYSMPANDDFALGINWWGGGILSEALNRAGWNYMNWFGQSGLLATFIQVFFNPLYWFKNAGHSFGICMIIVFVLVYGGILLAVRRLLSLMCQDLSQVALDIFTFALIIMIFCTYYYNDVYNWWSGVPGYSLTLLFMLICMGYIVKYSDTHAALDYALMIVFGIITCSGLMTCVACGSFYLCYRFIFKAKDGEGFIKKALPLVLFVASGLVTVLAPGNSSRMSFHEGQTDTERHYIQSLYVTLAQLRHRLVDTMVQKPWVLLMLVAILILGMATAGSKKIKLWQVILGYVITAFAAFGAVYPYVLGSNSTADGELAYRVYFMQDYMLYIGFAISTFMLGQWLIMCLKDPFDWDRIEGIFKLVSGLVLALFLAWCFVCPTKTYFVPTEIMANADNIKNTYALWNGILEEIKTSPDEDVVVTRSDVAWCRYVYPCGMSADDGNDWPVGEDVYYCGCNQGVARLYGKNTVHVILE